MLFVKKKRKNKRKLCQMVVLAGSPFSALTGPSAIVVAAGCLMLGGGACAACVSMCMGTLPCPTP